MTTVISHRVDCGPPRRSNPTYPTAPAVISWLTRGPTVRGMIELKDLLWLALHEQPHPQHQSPELRLAGYRGRAVPWGVRWGGTEQMRFEKDLRLPPRWKARGRRLDLRQQDVVQGAREMQRTLESYSRQPVPILPTRLQLPRLWAGFPYETAASLCGDGPEFWGACHQAGCSSTELLAQTAIPYGPLTMYPLDWVSHEWERCPQIFVELTDFPREQLVQHTPGGETLTGYRGACEFDFEATRFTGNGLNLSNPVDPQLGDSDHPVPDSTTAKFQPNTRHNTVEAI